MKEDRKVPKIKPKFIDYLMITATRFLPITRKLRKSIRYRLLKRKEDIVLYESKSYIVLQVPLALALGELFYMALMLLIQFCWGDFNGLNMVVSFLIEYICFLAAMPIITIAFYPFTAFWVRMEQTDKN